MNLYTKQKYIHRHKNKFMFTKREDMGRHKLESGIKITNLLDSTRNYTQYFIMTYKGKESEYVSVCVCK